MHFVLGIDFSPPPKQRKMFLSSFKKRSAILGSMRESRPRISKLCVSGHDESGNPNEVEINVSTQTIDSILRQKTRRITNIELEADASMAFLPDDATGLVSPSLSPAVAEKAPSSKNRPPCAYSPLYSEMSTVSTTSEINPAAPNPVVEPGFIFAITNIEPIRPKSSMKILTQEESFSSLYLSNRDRLKINDEDNLKLYAELRELVPSTPRRPIRRGRRSHSRRQDTGEDTSEPADSAEERSKLIKKQTQSLHILHPDAIFHLLSTTTAKRSRSKKDVRFGNVQVRTYDTILGDHPVAAGPSLSLGWAFEDDIVLNLEDYESSSRKYQGQEDDIINHLALPIKERETILRNIGYNLAQLLESELPKMIVQAQREETVANLKNENFKSVKSFFDDAKENSSTGEVPKTV